MKEKTPDANLPEPLTGGQKAAVLLFSLGEDLAAEILKNLDEEELKKLGTSMSRVFALSADVLDTVFEEDQSLASAHRAMVLKPQQRSQFIRNVFSKAI